MLGDESGLPWTILASRLRLRAHPVPPPEAEFLIIDFVWDGGLIKIVKPCFNIYWLTMSGASALYSCMQTQGCIALSVCSLS